MRIRSTGLVLFAGLTLIVGACTGGGAASSAPASEAAPSESAAASEAVPSESASASAATSDLKIGVVTDVGTVNDKNFNEYTYNGAKEGAAAIGAAEPPVVVPTSDADYEPMLQSFVDQGYQVIVATGFNLVPATTKLAKENGLEQKTFKSGKQQQAANYSEQQIEMTLAGAFEGFYVYLQQLERFERLIRVTKMDLTKMNEKVTNARKFNVESA